MLHLKLEIITSNLFVNHQDPCNNNKFEVGDKMQANKIKISHKVAQK